MKYKKKTPIEKQQFRIKMLRVGCWIGVFFLLGWGVSPYMKIGFNCTDSVDGYVFLIVKNLAPQKGGLVAFWPPKNDFLNTYWFVKYLKGVAGDEVVRQGQAFYINGEYIGAAKQKSKGGIVLKPSAGGVIPQGYYFVWTPHADSFDSRYEQIGWIPESSVIGRAYRIF